MVGSWAAGGDGEFGIFMAATEGHSWMQYIGSLL